MKRLALLILDGVDRLVEVAGWFPQLDRSAIAVQVWVREQDQESAAFIAPNADIRIFDSRLWSDVSLHPWWADAFAPLLEFAADEVVILDRCLSAASERLVMLFPTSRVTLWLPPASELDTELQGDISDLRLVLDTTATLETRIGLFSAEASDLPQLRNASPKASETHFLADREFLNHPFAVADMGDLLPEAQLACARGFAALIDTQPAAVPPVNGVLLLSDGLERPAVMCEALTASGVDVLWVCRSELDLWMRARLVYLSVGYVGRPSAELHLAKHIGRPVIQWVQGMNWQMRAVPLKSGRTLGCSVRLDIVAFEDVLCAVERNVADAIRATLRSNSATPSVVDVWPLAESERLRFGALEQERAVEKSAVRRAAEEQRFVEQLSQLVDSGRVSKRKKEVVLSALGLAG